MKQVGLIGLPRAGKTTLFEILMQGAGSPAPPGAGRDVVGVVRVPDSRIDRLSALFQPKKTTYAQIQFVDSAAAGHGSARAAAKGPDLFASVRQADALAAIVRDFDTPASPAENGVDPARDLREIEAELLLNDLAIVETRIERIEKELRVGKKQGEREHALLLRVKGMLEAERPLRAEVFDAEEQKLLRGFQLLSRKPLLVVYNQGDASGHPPAATAPGSLAVALRAHLEREIVALPPEERPAFREELGVAEDGLSLVIRACYELLGLISFFTVGPDEVRAWTIHRGERAVDAAGEIHSDLAKGFIRAETVGWEALLECGGYAKARERALLRLEGRDYEVKDGECLEIRFNK
jgi:GTP-binding protein YchF